MADLTEVKSTRGKLTIPQLGTRESLKWCPGCGDYAILLSLKQAIIELGLSQHEVVLVTGVGCADKLAHSVKVYGMHSLHGREIPVALGIKLANHTLTVIAQAGDGDVYGIGMGHFIHACRRNLDITCLVHDNMVYGLTKGQYSPTSRKGFKTTSSPHGSIEYPINPISLALSSGASFVARTFAGNVPHMTKTIVAAVKHKGFALIDVLQPCVTYNHEQTYDFYQKRVYDLQEAGHNAGDRAAALAKAEEWGERIPIGIFYQEEKPTYEGELPQLKAAPLARQPIEGIDITPLMELYL
ncbi:MAG: 2-oxoacid:ferredoxin oxidoreductase subunit beta [Candidatus Micrarchaeia archaeon]